MLLYVHALRTTCLVLKKFNAIGRTRLCTGNVQFTDLHIIVLCGNCCDK